jgi:hypothetical protein
LPVRRTLDEVVIAGIVDIGRRYDMVLIAKENFFVVVASVLVVDWGVFMGSFSRRTLRRSLVGRMVRDFHQEWVVYKSTGC